MKRTFTIILGLFAALIGLALICPAVAQLRASGSLPTLGVVLLLMGIAVMLAGSRIAVSGIRKRGA